MSIKIGGIDIANSVINLEFQVNKLSKIVEMMLKRSHSVFTPAITQQDIGMIEEEIFEELNRKYPEAGLTRKS